MLSHSLNKFCENQVGTTLRVKLTITVLESHASYALIPIALILTRRASPFVESAGHQGTVRRNSKTVINAFTGVALTLSTSYLVTHADELLRQPTPSREESQDARASNSGAGLKYRAIPTYPILAYSGNSSSERLLLQLPLLGTTVPEHLPYCQSSVM